MKKEFYRLRNLKSLFEFKELENQEIYFASPEELNDPMEGFKNLIFNGDKIVWRNFFKHYLLCLERVSSLYILSGEEHHKITQDSIPVFNGFDDFPTPMYKELFEKISKDFFDICGDFIDKIATRTTAIKRDELTALFGTIHWIAIEIIQKNYIENKFIEERDRPTRMNVKLLDMSSNLIDMMEQNIEEMQEDKLNALFFIQKSMQDEIILKNNVNDGLVLKAPNRNFVLIDFTGNYLNSLEKLQYNKWYTACFMSKYNNSSLWGHYGDSHKGVCLIFESDENKNINFTNVNTGFGSSEKYKLDFKQVQYKNEYPQIDFFRSIGRLPVGKIISTWYTSEDGLLSDIEREVFNDEAKWRKKYWNKFYENILTKTEDWSYENEHRLILFSVLNDEIDSKDRLLKYDFNNLKGLIFGIKTPIEEKLKIIDIIRAKCTEYNRDNFEFHQAYYCHIKKNIQSRKMGF
jgi:hypothetical protein